MKTATLLTGTRAQEVRNDWEVGHWTHDRLIVNAASNSVASHSTRAPRRRKTRYNTKTVTKTKKALSVLEAVHQRADCSKCANGLGTDDNCVPSVTSGVPLTHAANTIANTLVSHVSPVCSVFVQSVCHKRSHVGRWTEYAHNCMTSYKVE